MISHRLKGMFMNHFEEAFQDYWFGQPLSPSLSPVFGAEKLWEMENDYSYLKYLYPNICSKLRERTEEECDQLEYDGSIMFDTYPDKTALQQIARKIVKKCSQEDPDSFPADNSHIREMAEIILYNEILFRRNRYRNRKRLYF